MFVIELIYAPALCSLVCVINDVKNIGVWSTKTHACLLEEQQLQQPTGPPGISGSSSSSQTMANKISFTYNSSYFAITISQKYSDFFN